MEKLITEKQLGQEYPSPNEEAIIAKMVNELKAQLDRLYKDKKMLRQIHTRMHGCVKATFTILPDLPETLRIGVFKEAKTFYAWVRFSNAATKPKPDRKKDVRGIAIKLMGVPGEKILNDEHLQTTQDFLLMNTETFFSKNIEQFSGLLSAFTAPNKLKVIGYLLNPLHWGLLKKVTGSNTFCNNPAELNYYSTQPYQFGTINSAVKYFLKPWPSNNLIIENKSDPYYLRYNLAQTLNNNELNFDFFIQQQTDANLMPIEDPTIPWDSQFVKLATLTIPPQQFDSNAQFEFGDNLSFNSWHSLPEHRPLGSFNRARKRVYEALSAYRHKKNGVPMLEPQDSPDFLPKNSNTSSNVIDEKVPTKKVVIKKASVLVKCNKQTAFEYISSSVELPNWLKKSGPIKGDLSVTIIKGPYDFVGAQRLITFTDKSTVQEELISYNPFANYAYKITNFGSFFKKLTKLAFGQFWFDTVDDQTRITWVYSYTYKNIFARIIIWLFNLFFFKKFMQNDLNIAKVQIENGD
jgi:hypothetical protein